ncbi:MAG: hypothetical protein ABFS46_01895 [Myxococcota bacterium]
MSGHCRRGGPEGAECFDLAADPDEQHPEAECDGQAELDDWSRRMHGLGARLGEGEGRPIGPDDREHLRALGYLH